MRKDFEFAASGESDLETTNPATNKNTPTITIIIVL
jgi:hypothetical protein